MYCTQAIVINKEGTQNDVLHAVAFASVKCLVAYPQEHASWLDGRFVKSVRHTSKTGPIAALADAEHHQGEVSAYAFRPTLLEDMSRKVRSCQVQGIDHPNIVEEVDSPVTLFVNDDAGMSTGKMAAQAAHAFMIHYLKTGEQIVDPFNIRYINATEIESVDGWAVRDAGFTEIEPDTLTVCLVS